MKNISGYFILGFFPLAFLMGCGGGRQMDLSSTEAAAGVPGQPPEITYVDNFLPLVKNHCIACHGAIPSIPDWTKYDVAFADRNLIMQRVVINQDMPPGQPLSQADRQMVKNWIDQGARYDKNSPIFLIDNQDE